MIGWLIVIGAVVVVALLLFNRGAHMYDDRFDKW